MRLLREGQIDSDGLRGPDCPGFAVVAQASMQTVVAEVVRQVYEKFPRQLPGAPAPQAKSSAT